MAAAGFRLLALILVRSYHDVVTFVGLLSLLYVTPMCRPSATLLADSQDDGEKS